jgi:predicted dithiol-disulfide oxidoreductase (DUF899 family)
MSTTSAAPSSKKAVTAQHKIVSQKDWLKARQELLAKEKEHMRLGDALAAERRKLPWVKIEKNYVFDTPSGKKTLAELFDGRSQLLVYHLMFAPDWEQGCHGCSFVSDHFDGAVRHLANRGLTLVAVSRAPLAKLTPFKQRMGWHFKWYSSFGTDFNRDFHVSFTAEEKAAGKVFYNFKVQDYHMEEREGLSVFYKDEAGSIYHTYSTYARGVEYLMNTYSILDLAPKGRDEQDQKPHSMAWVRHHDKYENDYYAGIAADAKPSAAAAVADSTKSAATAAHDCCSQHT